MKTIAIANQKGGKQLMSENVEGKLETRLLQLENEFKKLISYRIPSLEQKIESMEVKTNKLLGLANDLEEKMLHMDQKLMRLSLQDKR